MSGQDRIQQLLEELLEQPRTPEEVCENDPDLLPEVQVRWAQVRRVAHQLDELFPGSDSTTHPNSPESEIALPQIAGYTVETVLGRGGMGLVFKAKQLKPNRPVALKMLLAGSYASPQELARFQREIEAVATLRHPNIAQIYEVGDHAGRPYYTMELVDGGTLTQQFAQALPTRRIAAELIATLAVTVQFAHKSGIIHRDLKPANILLTAPLTEGGPGTPKIADFGLARFVDAEPELTFTGARLGTPNYMAPEQALGKTADIGPAADIYALGAILYESLTGCPPFDSPTSVEIERRVISEEPTPPSRIRSNVPRDLETICLKCLHKNPARRYASAQDLADDLHRYLDGKPVLARPIGIIERTVMWTRRHPATAIFIVAILMLAVTGAGAGVWFKQQQDDLQEAKTRQRERAQDAVETALNRAGELRQQERWHDALLILTEAETRLADAELPSLTDQVRKAKSDIQLAVDLDRARGNIQYLPKGGFDYQKRSTEYRQLFESADIRIEDQDAVVAFIRASAIGPQVVAALEDWAYVAYRLKDDALADGLLRLARTADPEPLWRDKLRDTTVWKEKGMQRLRGLADTAFTTSPPPTAQQLALLGLLLREYSGGYRNTVLLAQACRRYPTNFWLNREMGDALYTDGRAMEAVGFYRAALALRPDNSWVHYKLSVALFELGQIEEALTSQRRAVELSPTNIFRAELVQSLALVGYWKEAKVECQKAMEADPTSPVAPSSLAGLLTWNGRIDEGLTLYRKAAEVGVNDCNTQLAFGDLLIQMNRPGEAVAHYRRACDLDPNQFQARQGLGRALAASGQPDKAIAAYEIAFERNRSGFRYEDDYAALLRDQGRPEEALKMLRKATAKGVKSGPLWDVRATAELDLGNFAEARAAIERAFGGEAPNNRRFKLCDLLLAIEKQLPAILAGKEEVKDAATARALAEWCWKHKRLTAAAARFYATAFALDPSRTADEEVSHRFNAVCVASLAGNGMGNDTATLSEKQRTELRKQALGWLTAEYSAWVAWLDKAGPGSKATAARAMRSWQQSQDLATVRDEKALTKFPADERREWQAFWANVAKQVERDPDARITQARAHIGRQEWKKAVECYSAAFELEATDNSDLWFECAACQLLAGDRDGYRRSCTHMLAAPNMRAYLVARACTLAPDSTDNLNALDRLSMSELISSRDEYWALTEMGALRVRANQPRGAIPRLEESLLADDRPGRAVLNWLWLALAYQSSNKDEARRWLDKAVGWLDQQEGQMPRESSRMGSHLHNWLEAHALRREVENLLSVK